MKAFPIIDGEANYKQEGMDLRDHFAGLAMQAIVKCCYDPNFKVEDNETLLHRGISITAYKIADAMMEARNDR